MSPWRTSPSSPSCRASGPRGRASRWATSSRATCRAGPVRVAWPRLTRRGRRPCRATSPRVRSRSSCSRASGRATLSRCRPRPSSRFRSLTDWRSSMTDTPITRLAVVDADGSTDYLAPLPPARGLVCRVPERPGLPLYVVDTEGRSVAVYAPGAWASFEVLERAEPEPEAEPEAEEAPELPFKVGDRVRVVANPRGFVSLRV